MWLDILWRPTTVMLMFKTTEDQLLFTSVAGECTYTALVCQSVMCVCVCEIHVQYFMDVVLIVCKGVCISCLLF